MNNGKDFESFLSIVQRKPDYKKWFLGGGGEECCCVKPKAAGGHNARLYRESLPGNVAAGFIPALEFLRNPWNSIAGGERRVFLIVDIR